LVLTPFREERRLGVSFCAGTGVEPLRWFGVHEPEGCEPSAAIRTGRGTWANRLAVLQPLCRPERYRRMTLDARREEGRQHFRKQTKFADPDRDSSGVPLGLVQFPPDVCSCHPVVASGGSRQLRIGAKFIGKYFPAFAFRVAIVSGASKKPGRYGFVCGEFPQKCPQV
jgi:hypothetical protein